MSDIYALSEDELVKHGESAGRTAIEKKLTPTQLRRFFSEIKAMDREYKKTKKVPSKLPLIIPKLAYAKARDLMPDKTYLELKENIQKIGDDPKKFERFVDFFEIMVAYAKLADTESKAQGRNYNDRD